MEDEMKLLNKKMAAVNNGYKFKDIDKEQLGVILREEKEPMDLAKDTTKYISFCYARQIVDISF